MTRQLPVGRRRGARRLRRVRGARLGGHPRHGQGTRRSSAASTRACSASRPRTQTASGPASTSTSAAPSPPRFSATRRRSSIRRCRPQRPLRGAQGRQDRPPVAQLDLDDGARDRASASPSLASPTTTVRDSWCRARRNVDLGARTRRQQGLRPGRYDHRGQSRRLLRRQPHGLRGGHHRIRRRSARRL